MCGLIHQPLASPAEIVFERTSPYHHIRVIDRKGTRTLSFNGSTETQMSLANPLQGHFEYTEYFQMPRLWNGLLTNVLMIGLGGGSTQRAYAHYFPHMKVETVEIDPFVVQVAKDFFQFKESPRQRVQVSDGRLHLRRTEARFGAILVDAYVQHRYGSSIPYHLATKEFFELAASRLTTTPRPHARRPARTEAAIARARTTSPARTPDIPIPTSRKPLMNHPDTPFETKIVDATDAKALHAEHVRDFEIYKETNDRRLDEIERRGAADPVTTDKVERLDRVLADTQRRIDALTLKSAANRWCCCARRWKH